MLGNEVQLFYKLLDSLSNSLRELAVKYELLIMATSRQDKDREKTDAVVMHIANDVVSSFAQMTSVLDQLKTITSEGRSNDTKLSLDIQSIANTIEDVRAVVLHVDSHMDDFGNQLTAIQTALSNITNMITAVNEMKQQFEPIKKLASLLNKPVGILVALYLVFMTVMTLIDGCSLIKSFSENTKKEHAVTQNSYHTITNYHTP